MTGFEAAANSGLENLRKWLIANMLSLNVAKTEFILIGSKPMIKLFLIPMRMFSLKIMSVKLSEQKLTSICLGIAIVMGFVKK